MMTTLPTLPELQEWSEPTCRASVWVQVPVPGPELEVAVLVPEAAVWVLVSVLVQASVLESAQASVLESAQASVSESALARVRVSAMDSCVANEATTNGTELYPLRRRSTAQFARRCSSLLRSLRSLRRMLQAKRLPARPWSPSTTDAAKRRSNAGGNPCCSQSSFFTPEESLTSTTHHCYRGAILDERMQRL
jgi:hypothetical protein